MPSIAGQSTTFVNFIDAHLNFSASSAGCVMITFSGVAFVNPFGSYEYLHVRTLLDGNSVCVPALTTDHFLAADNPSPETADSITRICKKVAASAHTLPVQYRSEFGDGAESMSHVLTATHN